MCCIFWVMNLSTHSLRIRCLSSLFGFAWLGVSMMSMASLSAQTPKPNVLFIAIDDLVPTLGCYGDEVAITPEIDALAAQGTTFLNHHCVWSVCGPSRVAMSTSLTPEETGVTGFRAMRHPDFLPDVITMPQHFKNQGYESACTGKFHDPRTVGDTTQPLDSNNQFPNGSNIDDLLSWSTPYVRASSGYAPDKVPDPDSPDPEEPKMLNLGL